MTSVPADQRHALLGAVLSGRLRLLRLLGQGGMGAVYEALEASGERVAVKVLFEAAQGTAATEALARFVREGRLTSALSHPHIVRVHDAGIDPATSLPWLSMQLLEGEDVEQLVMRVGPLPPSLAVRLITQAGRGLSAAHAAGVVHRDIKPSNLFAERQGDRLVVRVCDFGLAKVLGADQGLTATGSTLGSPLYMAPEQIVSARRADERADVWSLATTLYQCLAGQPPFVGMQTFAELAVAVTTREVPHLQDVAPWVDARLAQIVHGALIRDIDARCPNVDAFLRALEPYTGGTDAIVWSEVTRVSPEHSAPSSSRAPYPLTWRALTARLSPAAGASGERGDVLLGKVLSGRYELVRELGRGGMGAVYEARLPDGSRAAVKVIGIDPQAQSGEAAARFVREARAATAIKSPHVVRVLEADTCPTYGVPFLAMELLEGVDLERLVRDAGPLEPHAVATLGVQACEGLAAAHALGFVHRDVKPANLFLHQQPDGTVVVKVCDFGVAKQSQAEGDLAATDLTRTGGLVGSPMYMSPEQARNAKTVDARSDIWSLGLSLHQALTGRKPWGSATVGDLIVAICTQPPPRLGAATPWVSEPLARALDRAVERDPAARYAEVAELARALAPFRSKAPLSIASLTDGAHQRRAVASGQQTLASARGAEPSRPDGSMQPTAVDPPSGSSSAPPAPSRKPAALALGGLAVVGLAALAMVAGRASSSGHGASPPAASAPAAESASPPPSAPASPEWLLHPSPPRPKMAVKVPIVPRDTQASVDGEPVQRTPEGELILEGYPGDPISVELSRGNTRATALVVLSHGGEAFPREIELSKSTPRPGPAGSAGKPAPTDKPEPRAGERPKPQAGSGQAGSPQAGSPQAGSPQAQVPQGTTAAPPAGQGKAGEGRELPRPKDSW